MVNFWWTSASIILVTLTIPLKCEDRKYEALHFTRTIPRSVYDKVILENLDHPKMVCPTAIACLANSDEEVAFNAQKSLGKNSLFVRKTYERTQTSSEVEYYTCENPYKLSVLYHRSLVEFQFGFEIYYDKSVHQDKGFEESNRGDYDRITNTHAYANYVTAYSSYIPNIPLVSRLPSIPVVSRFLKSSLYLDNDGKKELGFLWIDLFQMVFNFKANRVGHTKYNLSVTTRGPQQCDDYDLGKEYFNTVEMDDLYHEDNQKKMLADVKLPTSNSDNENEEIACESENKCFIKWSTVPAEVFHQLATKPTSCSDLVTVPVWKSTIYEVLTKLDNFLFALSIFVGHPLGNITIHSGVHGVLQLPTNSSTKSIKLAENGAPVPDVIYKLINYTTRLCRNSKTVNLNEGESSTKNEFADKEGKNDHVNDSNSESANKNDNLEDLKGEPAEHEDSSDTPANNGSQNDEIKPEEYLECVYATTAIIVIIHNDPNFNPEKDQICKDKCEELGWEIIKYKTSSDKTVKSKYIYCCQANDENVQKKLKVKVDLLIGPDLQHISTKFSLKAVPVYNYGTEKLELHDARNLVVNAYKHLFEGAKFEPDEKDEWNSFMSKYYLRMGYRHIEESKNDNVKIYSSEVELENEGADKSAADSADSGNEE